MEIRLCAACERWSDRGVTRCTACGGQIVLGDESSLLGKALGRYRLKEVIGSGGMGIVFAAEHVGLGREVAVKALLPELDHHDVAERFHREARLLATLVHPHIVGIFDADIGSNGLPFYVMERLHGLSLGAALARIGRPLTVPELAPVFVGIARALDHAHRQQVVHRDLKPENIFLEHTATGTVAKLLDFGIAKRLGPDSNQSRLTQTGAVLGTPLYLSPEQLSDETLVPATDQFALALIIVECLIGSPVREGQSPTRMLRQALQDEVVDAVQWLAVPASVRPALRRALAFEPGRRFPSCCALIEALGLDTAAGDDAWIQSLGLASARSMPTPAPVTTAETTVRPPEGKATVPTPVPLPGPLPPPASTSAPPLPMAPASGRSGRRLRALGIAAAVVTAVLIGWWQRWGVPSEAPPAPDLQSESTEPAWPTAPRLRQTVQLTVPADAGMLLGAGNGSQALLTTRDGIYLHTLKADAPIVRQAIDGQALGTTRMGELLVLQGDSVSALDARGKAERERVLGQVPTTATWLAVDADGDWMVWIDAGRLSWINTGDADQHGAIDLEGARFEFMRVDAGIAAVSLQEPAEIQILRLSDGARLYRQKHELGRVYDLALTVEHGLVAVCGFEPHVEVFDWIHAGLPKKIPVANQCAATTWLPDGPGLVIRAHEQLVFWQASADVTTQRQELPWPGKSVGNGVDLPRMARAGGTVWLHEPELQTLTGFTLGPESWTGLNTPSGSEAWDVEVDGERIYVGLANGTLQVIEPGGVRALTVHEAGITDLVDGGDGVASASDDRTLAVWRKPGMDVVRRSRGHEFLVNQLWLAPDRSSLWSSSSDGKMKQWRWPDLEPMATVDTREVFEDPNLSLHAIWLNADQDLALLGTWNQRLLLLGKSDGEWTGAQLPVTAGGGYRLVELPEFELVVLLTVHPGKLFAFDLRERAFYRLPDYGLDLYGLSIGPGTDTMIAAGDSGLVLLRFDRTGDSTNTDSAPLRWQSRARQVPAVGVVYSQVYDQAQQRLLLANEDGVVFAVPSAQLGMPEQR